jgi:hypothetical protein
MLIFVLLTGCNEGDPAYTDYSFMSDLDGDGFSPEDGDCDDENALVSPSQPEVCDSIDNNCDGITDAQLSVPLQIFEDGDGDGYGGGSPQHHLTCQVPDSYSLVGGDCEDSDPSVHPDAESSWEDSLVDNDCDGSWEESMQPLGPMEWTLEGLEGIAALNEWFSRPVLGALTQDGIYQLQSTNQAILLMENDGSLKPPFSATESSTLLVQLEDPGTGRMAVASFRNDDMALSAPDGLTDLVQLRGMEALQILGVGDFGGSGRSSVGIIAEDESQRHLIIHPEGWVGSHDWDDGVSLLSSFSEPALGRDLIPLGDIDGDGYDDLAVLFEDSIPLRVFLGSAQPTMQPYWQLQAETGCRAQLVSDVTGDAVPELACIDRGAWLFSSYVEGGSADLFSAEHQIPQSEIKALHGVAQDLLLLTGEWEDQKTIRFHSLLPSTGGMVGWHHEGESPMEGFIAADLAADGTEDLFSYRRQTGEIALLELPPLP